jgi:hypothetical protein
MEASLTPELAVAYLRELSLDVLASVVLDGSGGYLAGSLALAGPAAALLAAPEAGEGLAIRTPAGWVVGARAETVGVVVAAGPLALAGLLRHDVAEVVGLLAGSAPVAGRSAFTRTPAEALQVLADAVQGAAPRVATMPSGDR